MPRSQLALAFVGHIQKAAAKSCELRLGSLAHRQIDDLLEQQRVSSTPMHFIPGRMQILGADYGHTLRASAADYATKLAQAIGIRKGMGKPQCQWVEQQAREFIQKLASPDIAKSWFIGAVSSLFTVANEKISEEAFLNGLAVAARDDRLMSEAKAQIELARAVYGRPRRYRRARNGHSVAPGEMLKDPLKYPTMTVEEVRQVIRMSKSSVYRLLDEGRLERASAGKEGDKKSRCLILTRSVIEFLEKSPY